MIWVGAAPSFLTVTVLSCEPEFTACTPKSRLGGREGEVRSAPPVPRSSKRLFGRSPPTKRIAAVACFFAQFGGREGNRQTCTFHLRASRPQLFRWLVKSAAPAPSSAIFSIEARLRLGLTTSISRFDFSPTVVAGNTAGEGVTTSGSGPLGAASAPAGRAAAQSEGAEDEGGGADQPRRGKRFGHAALSTKASRFVRMDGIAPPQSRGSVSTSAARARAGRAG